MSVIFERTSRHICRIILNRPKKRNAIDRNVYQQLREAIDTLDGDEDLQVAIVSGAGGHFCAGYDLQSIVDPTTGKPNLKEIKELFWPTGTRLSEKKITIAAIEGHAAGFGYELALKCDYRVIDRDTRMGFLNRRFSIPIMNGGTVILPQLIGHARAIELVTTGKAQLAQEALQYGLAHHVSDVGCSMGKAENFARSLIKFDNSALMNDLNSMNLMRCSAIQLESMRMERSRALEYLERCAPLCTATAFLRGELCRHGKMDLGTGMRTDPEVTL